MPLSLYGFFFAYQCCCIVFVGRVGMWSYHNHVFICSVNKLPIQRATEVLGGWTASLDSLTLIDSAAPLFDSELWPLIRLWLHELWSGTSGCLNKWVQILFLTVQTVLAVLSDGFASPSARSFLSIGQWTSLWFASSRFIQPKFPTSYFKTHQF